MIQRIIDLLSLGGIYVGHEYCFDDQRKAVKEVLERSEGTLESLDPYDFDEEKYVMILRKKDS